MTLGKRIAVAGFVAAAVLLATATGGFSAVAADRAVDISVADDRYALLGIEVGDTDGTVGGDPFTLLTLTDNFPQDVDADKVAVTSDGAPIEVTLDDDAAEADGELLQMDDRLDVTVACTRPTDGPESVTLHIVASGDDVTVTKDKTVTGVECTTPASPNPPGSQTVEFAGCGNVFVPDGYTVETYVYDVSTPNEAPVYEQRSNRGGNGKLVGIETAGNGTYVNENFDFETGDCGSQQGERNAGTQVNSPPWDD